MIHLGCFYTNDVYVRPSRSAPQPHRPAQNMPDWLAEKTRG